ncbi:sigma-70 family RNA polymerase sigma factor [Arachidicoccus terrestris]|uniref:sigma-70 family RNA polymerase sigma factor n=1 Tax=Arachidicoccus terrestris TaxID=2875539 RepID=UPI001CC44D35|nr:sigma-70 family RNA polymerase sigma factor [Arachidicoccus terrestris]UAY54186.1 sigma-70 family RNA polymerase sigma factor [Arachidicoccus terrestris]
MPKIQSHTDAELMHLLGEDDEGAFNEIYRRYWKLLFSVAVNKLEDYGDAEVAVQDVFTDLWNRRAAIEITYSLKSFLAGAVKFRVYATLAARQKLQRKKAVLTNVTRVLMEHSVDDIYRFKVLQEQITLASNKLPERCRIIYKLSREAGYSNKRIARKLCISEKTVENQITRALHQLRTAVQGMLVLLFILN